MVSSSPATIKQATRKPSPNYSSCHRALGISPTSSELSEFISILDPDSEGCATYEPFFAICALKFHARDDDSDARRAELDEAYSLFASGGGSLGKGHGAPGEGKITLYHLKKVVALLKEDVEEELLKDMILEANGGRGVGAGVGKDEFDDVMRRAGAWK